MPIFQRLIGDVHGVVVREMNPLKAPALSTLHPEEAALMGRAVEKRRQEFCAGRVMARDALETLGFPGAPLLPGEDRAPRWPDGAIGSITHTRGHCAVVAARGGLIKAIGIDVEQASPLKPGVFEAITTERDRKPLSGDHALLVGKIIFSAKECAYKAQYALTGQYLPFSAMWVSVNEAAGTWRATFNVPSGDSFRSGDVIDGRYSMVRGFVATAALLS